MMMKFNFFHMVTESPWPALSSIQTQSMMVSIVSMISKKTSKMSLMMNLMLMNTIAFMWWKNIISEASTEGLHLKKTMKSIKISMLMFISSEVLFFSSFFWSYFHAGSSPNIEVGQSWPPLSIESFNPVNVPLLNTMILVSSGFSVTWAHHLILEKKYLNAKKMLMWTCLLGVYFTILQKMEYEQSQFSMADSSYGTIFFMATGFHGIHVLIGTSFLMVNYMAMKKMIISWTHHMGFEMAAWYWHFVDVVWLMLYLSVYWWGK